SRSPARAQAAPFDESQKTTRSAAMPGLEPPIRSAPDNNAAPWNAFQPLRTTCAHQTTFSARQYTPNTASTRARRLTAPRRARRLFLGPPQKEEPMRPPQVLVWLALVGLVSASLGGCGKSGDGTSAGSGGAPGTGGHESATGGAVGSGGGTTSGTGGG